MPGQNPTYMRQLDGLRALCVAAVAWSHWRAYFGLPQQIFPGAELGVETFFVLSGFLITGILLDNRSQGWRPLVLKQFYIRRFLRIFPVFYVVLALALLLDATGIRSTWMWHAGYASNIYFYFHGWLGSLSHFWSLAVEEQFYIVWPLFILAIPARWLPPGILLTMLAAPVYAIYMTANHPGVSWITPSVLTPSCFSALGMGALVAYLVRNSSNPKTTLQWFLFAGLVGLSLWFAASAPLWLKPFARLAEDMVFGWLVFSVAGGVRGPVGWFLQCAPVSYLGRISYGIYIIHNFARSLVDNAVIKLGHPQWLDWLYAHPPVDIALLIFTTVGLASLSWHLYEKRLNDLKRFFPYPDSKRHSENKV
jgi:peptidoglycan/LPS O-acetylase OafA/YrhL